MNNDYDNDNIRNLHRPPTRYDAMPGLPGINKLKEQIWPLAVSKRPIFSITGL